MTDPTVYLADAADLDALAPLFDRYRGFYGQPSDPGRARRFLAERLARAESLLLLARRGAAALGFAQLYPGFSSIRCARAFVLNDLYVDAAARGLGIGRRLVEVALAEARRRGAALVTLETAVDNRRAQALYEACGFVRETGFLTYACELGAAEASA